MRKWDKEDVNEKVTILEALIEVKEEQFKKAQKEYGSDQTSKKDYS